MTSSTFSLVLRRAQSLLPPVLLLCAWEAAARFSILPPSLSAAPSAVARTLGELLRSGGILKHAAISLLRLSSAVLLGTLAGIGSGLILSQSPRASQIFSPTIQVLAPVPVVVWIPFVIMTVGSGEFYKITLALIATFFLVHLHVFEAALGVERDFLELAHIYEKSQWQKIRHILFPAALPSIFTALRLSLAVGWVVIFFGELSTSRLGSEGLGWFITDARSVGRIEEEYAGVVVLAALGALTDRLVAAIQRRVLMWADTLVATSFTQS